MEANTKPKELSQHGIQKMTRQIQQELIVQIINFKKNKSAKISCDISDGIHKIRGYISQTCQIKQSDQGSIIQVKAFGLLAKGSQAQNQQNKPHIMGVLVHICSIIDHYDGIIGEPTDILEGGQVVANYKEQKPKIDQTKLKSYRNNNGNRKSNGPIQKTESKNKKVTLVIQEQQPDEEELLTSEKISDLYTDLANWQIIAKITKKHYKQFHKANQGKLIKLLSLELIDSAGMKIGGTMFGDAALDYDKALQQDKIYRISKGQIRQDTYNANKNIPNHSKYTIMFTRNSQFTKIHQELPQFDTSNRFKTLSQVLQNPKINQQYDLKTIIIGIQDQVQIHKEVKTLIKQNLELYDPINQINLEAVIWNRSIKIDKKNLVGRVVGLYGWRLGRFNDKWSFNSGYNSQIRILQGKNRGNYAQFDSHLNTSEIMEQKQRQKELKRQANKINDNKEEFSEEEVRYLKDIEDQVIADKKQVRSTVNVFIAFLGYKKWYYDSCPHCRRSAQPQSKCHNCEKVINQTIPKYKLNVQLNDFSGSIWATGFQELGHKLFQDLGQSNPIKYLLTLDENQIKSIFEQRHFKQFIIKLTSKLDRDGVSVKHTVNKVIDINLSGRINENYKRIQSIIQN